MKFKVGDKVRVRKNLEVKTYKNNNGGELSFVPKMLIYKGQTLTIVGVNHYGNYEVRETNWNWSDEMLEPVSKSSILDDVEFDYLWNIIKPFKDKVEHIRKDIHYRGYFIRVVLKDMDYCCLPYFPKDSSMYKGMELDKHYTLEELGFVEAKPKYKFNVGDIVKVIDVADTYKRYESWTGLTKELKGKWEYSATPNKNREYIVRNVKKHDVLPNTIYAIESIDNKVFIMGEKGLEIIEKE